MEIAEIVNGVESMMQLSEDYVWVITDQAMSVHRNVMDEHLSKGVKFNALIHKRLVNPSQLQVMDNNEERRVLSAILGLFLITEKETFVSFLSIDGKICNSGFFGSDASFMRWDKYVSLYYWDKGTGRYLQPT